MWEQTFPPSDVTTWNACQTQLRLLWFAQLLLYYFRAMNLLRVNKYILYFTWVFAFQPSMWKRFSKQSKWGNVPGDQIGGGNIRGEVSRGNVLYSQIYLVSHLLFQPLHPLHLRRITRSRWRQRFKRVSLHECCEVCRPMPFSGASGWNPAEIEFGALQVH